MSIIMPIYIVKVYYNSALVLYAKGLVFKAVIVIFIIFIAVNKWLKVLLAISVLIKNYFIKYKVSKSYKVGNKRLL